MAFPRPVAAFLKKNHLGVLATSSPSGKPEAALVDFFTDDHSIYFLTRLHSRKVVHLGKNKKIALTVSVPEDWSTMQIEGDAKLLSKKSDVDAMFRVMKKNRTISDVYFGTSDEPFQTLVGTAYQAYKIKPTWIRWLHKNKGGTPHFEQILGKPFLPKKTSYKTEKAKVQKQRSTKK